MTRKKKFIGTIDAETDPFKYGREPKPFAWGFYDGDYYIDFWGEDCTKDFVEYLASETDEITLYAHNGGKFDFFFLLPYLDEELKIINGRIAQATMFDGRVTLRDSMLILPLPLSSFQKDEISYDKFEAEVREQHKPEIRKYLRGDCIYLHEWVTYFTNEFGHGLTLAGAAFKQLKKTSYQVINTNEKFDERMRPYYFGGRVQCFKTGAFKEDLQYVDINSAYSFAMMFQHWHGKKYKLSNKLPKKAGSWFARVNAVSRGALPHRGIDGKLYFPDDGTIREYMATGWEIYSGFKTGTLEIKDVIEVYKPILTENFKEYVDKFFALKKMAEQKGDKALRQFAKFMLNSCYGKFGQDGRDFEQFVITKYGEWPEGEDWEMYAKTATGEAIFKKPDPSDRFYNVATAASITGFVRAYLWESIHASDGVLYCDTDSIVCSSFGGKMGKALGEWDLEAEVDEAYIAQRKMYAMHLKDGSLKTASKGVRLSYDEIKEGVLTGENVIQERMAPAYSLKYGARFFSRETNFKNIAKNSRNNPPSLVQ